MQRQQTPQAKKGNFCFAICRFYQIIIKGKRSSKGINTKIIWNKVPSHLRASYANLELSDLYKMHKHKAKFIIYTCCGLKWSLLRCFRTSWFGDWSMVSSLMWTISSIEISSSNTISSCEPVENSSAIEIRSSVWVVLQ